MYSSKEELLEGIKKEGVEYVDIRFCDLPGVMQHFSIPASAFDEDVFEDGLAFDGSSVRGFQSINESDMMLLPDPATARIDPFRKAKTMNLSFFVHDPFTREPFGRDPGLLRPVLRGERELDAGSHGRAVDRGDHRHLAAARQRAREGRRRQLHRRAQERHRGPPGR